MTIDNANGSRIISHIELSPEQLRLAQLALQAGMQLAASLDQLHAALPPDTSSQFYGNWDLLRLDPIEAEPTAA